MKTYHAYGLKIQYCQDVISFQMTVFNTHPNQNPNRLSGRNQQVD